MFDATEQYTSRRSPVIATGGVVASSQPLATMAGLEILRQGGTAADAAVATAAALQVTQPCSTGLGGDAFCLYYEAASGEVKALNGSGRSPEALTLDRVSEEAFERHLPDFHPWTVTVPGAAAAWEDTVGELGRLPLANVLAPARRLAAEGFPVAPRTAGWWQGGVRKQLGRHRHGGELTIDGRGPKPGEIFRNPGLAAVLETLGEQGSRAFYEGWIAERIVEAMEDEGGLLTASDLAAHRSEWVEPIWIDYRGVRIWECPPNGQGLAALLALNTLAQFDLSRRPAGGFDRMHLMIEAVRLAFTDALAHVADPRHVRPPLAQLLSAEYAAARARQIDPARVNLDARSGLPAGTDTVYFCTADADGNACSFINSNFMGFGTGIVPRGCGFSLQNRGRGFVLDPEHPNALAPRKRPYHTIIPGMATNADGSLYAAFGVMGGMMQPQGHLQVVSAMVDDGLDPQAALDRPRFQVDNGQPWAKVLLEPGLPADTVARLNDAGHRAELRHTGRNLFGLGQIIRALPAGEPTLFDADEGPEQICWAGSDGRADGMAAGLP